MATFPRYVGSNWKGLWGVYRRSNVTKGKPCKRREGRIYKHSQSSTSVNDAIFFINGECNHHQASIRYVENWKVWLRLTKNNYEIWCIHVKVWLRSQDMWEAIEKDFEESIEEAMWSKGSHAKGVKEEFASTRNHPPV